MWLFLKIIFLFISVVQSQILQSTDSNENTHRTEAIINDILSNQCGQAERLLLATPNYYDLIPKIVSRVYNNSEDNTNHILNCVDRMHNVDMCFLILRSFRDEMLTLGHTNPVNHMKLVNTLERKVLYPVNNRNDLKINVRTLIENITHDIEEETLKILKTAMLANNFQHNVQIQNLTTELFDFRRNLSDTIMHRLVNETFGRMSAIDIADNIYYGIQIIPQIVWGLLSVVEKFVIDEDTTNGAILRFAKYIKILKTMDNYHRLPKKQKITVNVVVDSLPRCARSLYFARDLCIINRARVEKLYSSDSQFYFTRRSVFTCPMDKMNHFGIWRVEEADDKFYFQSALHNKEYLYASTSDKDDSGNRYVQTWMDDGFLGETSAWNIELFGDFCYIRNENFNEYMFAADRTYGEDKLKRVVFTSKEKGSTDADLTKYQWTIADCG